MAVAKRKSYKEKKEYIDNSKEKLEGFLADKGLFAFKGVEKI